MNNVVTRRAFESVDRSFPPVVWFDYTVIRLTIETGTLTAIAAIIDLVFFLKESNGLHQVSGVILCKLYSNSLLVLFNNRKIIAASSITHHLSDDWTNTTENHSTLETFRATPRRTVLSAGLASATSKGKWETQIESVPLEDLTPGNGAISVPPEESVHFSVHHAV